MTIRKITNLTSGLVTLADLRTPTTFVHKATVTRPSITASNITQAAVVKSTLSTRQIIAAARFVNRLIFREADAFALLDLIGLTVGKPASDNFGLVDVVSLLSARGAQRAFDDVQLIDDFIAFVLDVNRSFADVVAVQQYINLIVAKSAGNDIVRPADSRYFDLALRKADAVIGRDAQALLVNKSSVDSTTFADALKITSRKLLRDSTAIDSYFALRAGKAIFDDARIVEITRKDFGKVRSDAFAVNQTQAIKITKAVADSTATDDVKVLKPGLGKADAFTVTENRIGFFIGKGLGDNQPMTDLFGVFDGLIYALSFQLFDALAVPDAFARTFAARRSNFDVLSSTDRVVPQLGQTYRDNTTVVDVPGNLFGKAAFDSIVESDITAKFIGAGRSDRIEEIDVRSFLITNLRQDSIGNTDVVIREFGKQLDDTNVAADLIAKFVGRATANSVDSSDQRALNFNAGRANTANTSERKFLTVGKPLTELISSILPTISAAPEIPSLSSYSTILRSTLAVNSLNKVEIGTASIYNTTDVSGGRLIFTGFPGARYIDFAPVSSYQADGANWTYNLDVEFYGGAGSNGLETPDAGEDLVLQYSTDGGANFTTAQTLWAGADSWSSLVGANSSLVVNASVSSSASTGFIWRIAQFNYSNPGFDQYAVVRAAPNNWGAATTTIQLTDLVAIYDYARAIPQDRQVYIFDSVFVLNLRPRFVADDGIIISDVKTFNSTQQKFETIDAADLLILATDVNRSFDPIENLVLITDLARILPGGSFGRDVVTISDSSIIRRGLRPQEDIVTIDDSFADVIRAFRVFPDGTLPIDLPQKDYFKPAKQGQGVTKTVVGWGLTISQPPDTRGDFVVIGDPTTVATTSTVQSRRSGTSLENFSFQYFKPADNLAPALVTVGGTSGNRAFNSTSTETVKFNVAKRLPRNSTAATPLSSMFTTGSVSMTNSGNLSISADFTIETYLFVDNFNSSNINLVTIGNAAPNQYTFGVNSAGKLFYTAFGSSPVTFSDTVNTGRWYHLAFVRLGDVLTAWINGYSQGSAYVIGSVGNTQGIRILETTANMYVSQFRIIDGLALYQGTDNFAVPRGDLENVAGTTILLPTYDAASLTSNYVGTYPLTVNGSFTTNVNVPYVIDNGTTDRTIVGGSDIRRTSGSILENTAFNFIMPAKAGSAYTIFTETQDGALDTFSSLAVLITAQDRDRVGIIDSVNANFYVDRGANDTLSLSDSIRRFYISFKSFADITTMLDLTNVFDGLVYVDTKLIREFLVIGLPNTTRVSDSDLERTSFRITKSAKQGAALKVVSGWGANVVGTSSSSDFIVAGDPSIFATTTSVQSRRSGTSLENFSFQYFKSADAVVPAIVRPGSSLGGRLLGANQENISFRATKRLPNFLSIATTSLGVNSGAALFTRTFPTGQYLSTTVTAPGTDSVTYEWWFLQTSSTGTQGMLQTRTSTSGSDGIDVSVVGSGITVSTSGIFLLGNGSAGVGTVTLNSWNHVAVVRNGLTTNFTAYLNGISVGTFSKSGLTGTELSIGRKSATGFNEFFDGYLTNFRYVKGAALYTSNFAIPTSSLSAISGSAAGGSMQFASASSNRLTVASSSAFTFGTNNHTIEFWLYQTSRSTFDTVWTYGNGAGTFATNDYYFNCGTSQFQVILGNGSSYQTTTNLTGGNAPSLNAWHHCAIVRNGTALTLYLDGSSQGTITTTTAQSITAQAGAMLIGGNGSLGITGYIANFRIVNGTAVYTGNFVPTTTSLPNIANTQLLLLASSSGGLVVDSSINNNTVNNINSVVYNATTPFPGYNTDLLVNSLDYDGVLQDSSGYNRSVINNNGATVTTSVSPFSSTTVITTIDRIGQSTDTVQPQDLNSIFKRMTFVAKAGAAYSITRKTIDGLFENQSSVAVGIGAQQLDQTGVVDFYLAEFATQRPTNDSVILGSRIPFRTPSNIERISFLVTKFFGDDRAVPDDFLQTFDGLTYRATLLARDSLIIGLPDQTRVSGSDRERTSFVVNKSARQGAILKVVTGWNSSVTGTTSSGDFVVIGDPSTAASGQSRRSGATLENFSFQYFKPADNLVPAIVRPGSSLGDRLRGGNQENISFRVNKSLPRSFSSLSTSSATGSIQLSSSAVQYLSVPANAAMTLGTANHTIEWWQYQYSRATFDVVWEYSVASAPQSSNNYYMNCGTDFALQAGYNGTTWAIQITAMPAPTLNAWHHMAIVRNGDVWTVYVDGAVAGTGTSTVAGLDITAQTTAMTIGSESTGGLPFNGLITNFRFVKGTAVYTTPFTPPAAPLNVISGTQLLLSVNTSTSVLTDSSANNFTVNNVNGATYSAATPFTFDVTTTIFPGLSIDPVQPQDLNSIFKRVTLVAKAGAAYSITRKTIEGLSETQSSVTVGIGAQQPDQLGIADLYSAVYVPLRSISDSIILGSGLPFRTPSNTERISFLITKPFRAIETPAQYIYGSDGNIVPWSEDFTTSVWVSSGVTPIADQTTAPDSTLTADKLVVDSGFSYIQQNDVQLEQGETYTHSVYLKGDGSSIGRICAIGNFDSGNRVGQTSITLTADWQRLSATFTTLSAGPSRNLFIQPAGVAGANLAVGQAVFVWGYQVTTGSTLTAYVRTTSTAGLGVTSIIPGYYDDHFVAVADRPLLTNQKFAAGRAGDLQIIGSGATSGNRYLGNNENVAITVAKSARLGIGTSTGVIKLVTGWGTSITGTAASPDFIVIGDPSTATTGQSRRSGATLENFRYDLAKTVYGRGANWFSYSEDATSGLLAALSGSKTANVYTAPDGTLTGTQINGSTGISRVGARTQVTPGSTYTLSFYAYRTGETTAANWRISNPDTNPPTPDGEVLINTTSYFSSLTLSSWTRIVIPLGVITSTHIRADFMVGIPGNMGIWGWQLNEGNTALPYTRTTAVAQTVGLEQVTIGNSSIYRLPRNSSESVTFNVTKPLPRADLTSANSIVFDGNSYLSNSGDFSQASLFTMETWIYVEAFNSSQIQLLCLGDESTGRVTFGIGPNGEINYNIFGEATTSYNTSISAGTWTHIAFTRNSLAAQAWVNGTSQGVRLVSTGTVGNANGMRIGSDGAKFYLSQYKFTPLVRLYATDFTPSTTLAEAVAGTSGRNAAIVLPAYDASNYLASFGTVKDLTTSGTLSFSNFGPFAVYDGRSDVVKVGLPYTGTRWSGDDRERTSFNHSLSAKAGSSYTITRKTFDGTAGAQSSVLVGIGSRQQDAAGIIDFLEGVLSVNRIPADSVIMGGIFDPRVPNNLERISFLVTKFFGDDRATPDDFLQTFDGLTYAAFLLERDTQTIGSGALAANNRFLGSGENTAFDVVKSAKQGVLRTVSSTTTTATDGERLFVGQQYTGIYRAGDGLERIQKQFNKNIGPGAATTNLLTWSEDVTQAAFSQFLGGSITANVYTAPDGSQTGGRMIGIISGGRTSRTIAVTPGVPYVWSFYAYGTETSNFANYRVVNSANTNEIIVPTTSYFSQLAVSSWTRIVVPLGTIPDTVSSIRLDFNAGVADSIGLWGWQLNRGTSVDAYLRTTAAALPVPVETVEFPDNITDIRTMRRLFQEGTANLDQIFTNVILPRAGVDQFAANDEARVTKLLDYRFLENLGDSDPLGLVALVDRGSVRMTNYVEDIDYFAEDYIGVSRNLGNFFYPPIKRDLFDDLTIGDSVSFVTGQWLIRYFGPDETIGDLDPFGNINTLINRGTLRITNYVEDIDYFESDYIGESRTIS